MKKSFRGAAIVAVTAGALAPAMMGCEATNSNRDASDEIRNNVAAERALGEIANNLLGNLAITGPDVATYSHIVQSPYKDETWTQTHYQRSDVESGRTCDISFTTRLDEQGSLGGWVYRQPVARPAITDFEVVGANETIKLEIPKDGTPTLEINGTQSVAMPGDKQEQLTGNGVQDAHQLARTALELCGAVPGTPGA